MNTSEYKALHTAGTKQLQTFEVLEDQDWHCRNHAYNHIVSGQIAGSGGSQGLKRGSATRPGLTIEHESRYCAECGRAHRHDRWTRWSRCCGQCLKVCQRSHAGSQAADEALERDYFEAENRLSRHDR